VSARRGAVVAISAITTLGAGCAGGAYSLGAHATHGAAMGPPTSARGTTTGVTYREYGGPIGKTLLLLFTTPMPPTGTSRELSRSKVCYSTYCETTTTYEYTPPTEEEMRDFSERKADWAQNVAPAILSGAIAMEVVIDVATRDLGGDTSGAMMQMSWRTQTRSLLFFQGMSLSMGMAWGDYTLHGREGQVLLDSGTALVPMSVTEDLNFVYVGTPVRLTGLITPRLGVYGQFDLNWQPLFAGVFESREQPQLSRGGVQLWLPFMFVGAEAVVDRFRPDSLSFTLEAGLAF